MTYESEIEILKKEYQTKKAEFNASKKPCTGRDSNGNEEHKIDIWFLDEINKLKAKYNISKKTA